MLQWSENLATHIDLIDMQHKELIKHINALESKDRENLDSEELEKFVRFLGGYVVEHFVTEEEAMIKCNYPDYDAHKAAHMDLLLNYSSLKQKFDEEESPYLMLIVIQSHFLDWLSDHILTFDKKMAEFLKSRDKITRSFIPPLRREPDSTKSFS